MTLCRRAVAVMVNMAVILAIAVGAPLLLLRYLGNPLRFVADHLRELDDPHMSPTRLTFALIVFGWLLWLLLVASLGMETVACMRGVHAPRLPGLRPVQALAAAIVAGHTATLLAPALAAAAPTTAGDSYHPASTTTAATMSVSGQTGHVDSPAIALAGNTSYSYLVKRGDNLSKIANAWLGDPSRWPEICALNKHRHFPAVGGTLRNCNLIYPGWDLHLPADARPPTHATPTPPIPNPPPAPVSPVPSISPPSADGSNGKSDDKSDDGVTAVVPTPGVGTGSQSTVSPPIGATGPTHPAASATVGGTIPVPATRDPTPDGTTRTPVPDGHGVRLPDGSWVTWTLAAAITAATALVWLQRRRRFIPETDDDPITELPAPVNQLRRALAQHPQPTHHLDWTDLSDPSDRAGSEPEPVATAPEPSTLPAGGIGLLGEGAEAAARAALVAALASGDPEHPHGRGQVVIDTTSFTALTGADAALFTQWPRLHLAADLDRALTVTEEQLLHRSRILDQHSLSDLDSLRQQAPDEEALPPILLICHTPPGNAQMRTKACMALGAEVQVSVVVLGEWAHGVTVEVAADGRTRLVAGQPTQPIPARIPVLQTAATAQILATLQEAHTGRPSAPTTAQVAASASASVALAYPRAVNASDPAAGDPAAVPDTAAPAGFTAKEARARLRVLGTPRIDNITAPGRPLRAKALELAVFLACHPDGASTRDIGEYLEPDARLSQADQRVHTNASNLRHNLARTAPAANNGYVVKFAGRYRLDAATVDVDVWRLRDLLRRGSIAAGERRRDLLTEACDLYTAPLADGQDYEWITPHREAVRRCATEAHLLLADDLLDTDPAEALHLLDKAIGLDRYNEALYRKAMQARHALGDTDGIRTLLRALTRSLSDLDAEPDEETLTLAANLRSSPPAPATTKNVPRSRAVTDAGPTTATRPDIGAGQAGITDRSQASQNGAIR